MPKSTKGRAFAHLGILFPCSKDASCAEQAGQVARGLLFAMHQYVGSETHVEQKFCDNHFRILKQWLAKTSLSNEPTKPAISLCAMKPFA